MMPASVLLGLVLGTVVLNGVFGAPAAPTSAVKDVDRCAPRYRALA